MIKKIILYSFIFLISLVSFLLALMPAQFIWDKVLAEQVSPGRFGVQVQRVAGSIWQGQVLFSYQGIVGLLDWDLDPSGMFLMSLPVTLDLDSHVGKLQAKLDLSMSEIGLRVNKGEIDLKPLSPLFRAQRVNLDGQILIQDIQLILKDQRLVYAKGMASWSGGDIAYPAGREQHQRTLPMFKAVVDTKDNGVIEVGIRDQGAAFDVIAADLSPDGNAMLKVTRRLLDLSDEPWSINSREQDVVFKVKKPLY